VPVQSISIESFFSLACEDDHIQVSGSTGEVAVGMLLTAIDYEVKDDSRQASVLRK
jgi:hypothetical protein